MSLTSGVLYYHNSMAMSIGYIKVASGAKGLCYVSRENIFLALAKISVSHFTSVTYHICHIQDLSKQTKNNLGSWQYNIIERDLEIRSRTIRIFQFDSMCSQDPKNYLAYGTRL